MVEYIITGNPQRQERYDYPLDDGLTVEELLSNNYGSKTRNKLIALMFKECSLIEKYGSGISRIKKLCHEHGILEPKFQEIQKGFKVTLYKEKLDEGVKKLLQLKDTNQIEFHGFSKTGGYVVV